jgi:hypothetical protein
MASESIASARRVRLASRRALALGLRKQGASFRAIATTLAGSEGVSERYDESQAYDDVTIELRRLQAKNSESAGELRVLLEAQLLDLHAAYWQRARSGDYQACDRILAIMDRRARLAGVGGEPLAGLLRVLDLGKLSVEQLERLAAGEDLLRVLVNQ